MFIAFETFELKNIFWTYRAMLTAIKTENGYDIV